MTLSADMRASWMGPLATGRQEALDRSLAASPLELGAAHTFGMADSREVFSGSERFRKMYLPDPWQGFSASRRRFGDGREYRQSYVASLGPLPELTFPQSDKRKPLAGSPVPFSVETSMNATVTAGAKKPEEPPKADEKKEAADVADGMDKTDEADGTDDAAPPDGTDHIDGTDAPGDAEPKTPITDEMRSEWETKIASMGYTSEEADLVVAKAVDAAKGDAKRAIEILNDKRLARKHVVGGTLVDRPREQWAKDFADWYASHVLHFDEKEARAFGGEVIGKEVPHTRDDGTEIPIAFIDLTYEGITREGESLYATYALGAAQGELAETIKGKIGNKIYVSQGGGGKIFYRTPEGSTVAVGDLRDEHPDMVLSQTHERFYVSRPQRQLRPEVYADVMTLMQTIEADADGFHDQVQERLKIGEVVRKGVVTAVADQARSAIPESDRDKLSMTFYPRSEDGPDELRMAVKQEEAASLAATLRGLSEPQQTEFARSFGPLPAGVRLSFAGEEVPVTGRIFDDVVENVEREVARDVVIDAIDLSRAAKRTGESDDDFIRRLRERIEREVGTYVKKTTRHPKNITVKSVTLPAGLPEKHKAAIEGWMKSNPTIGKHHVTFGAGASAKSEPPDPAFEARRIVRAAPKLRIKPEGGSAPPADDAVADAAPPPEGSADPLLIDTAFKRARTLSEGEPSESADEPSADAALRPQTQKFSKEELDRFVDEFMSMTGDLHSRMKVADATQSGVKDNYQSCLKAYAALLFKITHQSKAGTSYDAGARVSLEGLWDAVYKKFTSLPS